MKGVWGLVGPSTTGDPTVFASMDKGFGADIGSISISRHFTLKLLFRHNCSHSFYECTTKFLPVNAEREFYRTYVLLYYKYKK